MSTATEAEYGSWKSPISASSISSAGKQFLDLAVDRGSSSSSSKQIYWVEARPAEAGRYVVCSCDPTVGSEGQVEVTSWTPDGMSARTRVHEYGGGALTVHNGAVYFSNMSDQRLYKQTAPTATPEPITPEGEYFYADACHHGNAVYCVREDHELVKSGARTEAENSIVRVCNGSVTQLVHGSDFYSCPRVSPDASKIAWVQWDHPNMPWDHTSIYVAQLTPDGAIVNNSQCQVTVPNVQQPIALQNLDWTPDSEHLLYIGDQSGFSNLYLYNINHKQHKLLFEANTDLAMPCWMFRFEPYCIDYANNSLLLIVKENVIRIDLNSAGIIGKFRIGNYTHLQYPCLTPNAIFCCVAASATAVPVVAAVAVGNSDSALSILRKSNSQQFDVGYISVGKAIEFKSKDGAVSHAYYYAPQNKDFTAPAGTKPPLLVKAHGGPTGWAKSTLNYSIQYWTSRGYAIADVDYRGSAGYGKHYRGLLRYNWGLMDVQDCCAVVQHLAQQGLVDADRACIDGGSAGGYTTLACLAFTDTFKAGASHYGVADLSLLMTDTHKFESRYLDNLLGDSHEKRLLACQQRSPINFVDNINCPLVLFQGDEDKIVPPNQSELMFNKVKEKGLACAYILFNGEQHGFRKAENINTALNGQFYFFAKVFGFTPADTGIEIHIHNL